MDQKTSVIDYLALLGPYLVALWTVSAAAWLIRSHFAKRQIPSNTPGARPASKPASEQLRQALECAVDLNGMTLEKALDPSVRLQGSIRYTPTDYREAAVEISQHFRAGRIISLDLRNMDRHQGARLVDFCSGLTSAWAGWIFLVAEEVIVITPAVES